MRSLVFCSLGLAVGCGGTVVFEADGGQGGDGAATTTVSAATGGPSSATASASSGVGGCTSHDECPEGVCVFASGLCALTCLPDSCDRCTPGEVCEGCATSSCAACKDCVSACVPTPPGRCDDDDPCGAQQVCVFHAGLCAPGCDAPECLDPNMVCEQCVTSSGCGDDDCVGACIPAGG